MCRAPGLMDHVLRRDQHEARGWRLYGKQVTAIAGRAGHQMQQAQAARENSQLEATAAAAAVTEEGLVAGCSGRHVGQASVGGSRCGMRVGQKLVEGTANRIQPPPAV